MLQTKFPRIPGDIGNAASFPFPILCKSIATASPERVVRQDPSHLLPRFIEAGQALIQEGAKGITTSCGFLSIFQEELAAALPVPVASSSLMQISLVNRLLAPSKKAGILTISASTLTERHLQKAGVPAGTPIGTTEGGTEFTRAILNDEEHLNIEAARRDCVEAALALQSTRSELGAIVLECTNMGPYAADIHDATGLPVFSILNFISWFQSSLQPPDFD